MNIGRHYTGNLILNGFNTWLKIQVIIGEVVVVVLIVVVACLPNVMVFMKRTVVGT